MRRLRLPIIAAALAFAPAARAEDFNPGLTCVYNSVAAADLLVAEAVERERRSPAGGKSAALDRVSARAETCASRYGWTTVRTLAAINYTIARVMHENAVEALRARGLDSSFLDQVEAELGDSGIAALMSSSSDSNLDLAGNAVMRRLAALGHHIPPGSEERVRLGREIGRGLVGRIGRDRAIADFNRR